MWELSANLAMATVCSLQFPKPFGLRNAKQTSSTSFPHTHANPQNPSSKVGQSLTLETPGSCVFSNSTAISALVGAGFALTLVGPAFAADLPLVGSTMGLSEPVNALSLPTWAVHVSSVAEWATAMVLVWQYGEKSGYESWKGLSWGMVPLLGGAFCACTWHFFYNSESLEVLVALQSALTVIGNMTMCVAAYRIYKSSKESSENL